MKGAQALRPDKTGKALLTVLRHLGRLQEVRGPSALPSSQTPCSSCACKAAACAKLHVQQGSTVAGNGWGECVAAQLRLNVEGSMQPVYIVQ